jgi:hypothetical protein
MNTKLTEWKVRIASLASFVASLAVVTVLEVKAPEFIETLPAGVQALAGAALVALSSWYAGRRAKSKPGYLSQSTIDAVKAILRERDRGA